ncbi:MAG: putative 3-methyladenine DNA glycosylase [Candidatus Anoxychlamydiales bacterium]|nr:putative 3-methyladenine DNA glycosylase [Candidatus Anoxychlamydiales bacterium]
MIKLDLSFYQNSDTISIAESLLGKYIYTKVDNKITSGIITETEAYLVNDKACHAYNNNKTPRTKVMFDRGGIAYIYLCYGMHHLLNIVTNKKDIPEAVLIRSIEPIDGIDIMQNRRNKKIFNRTLTTGPGSLTKALGITKNFNYKSFLSNELWIEDKKNVIKDDNIIKSKRVGIEYALQDALLPYRFRIKDSKWTSFPK